MHSTHVSLFVLTDDVIDQSIANGTVKVMFDVKELIGELRLGNNAILSRLYDSSFFGLNMYDSPTAICEICQQNHTRCPGHTAVVDLGFRYILPLYVDKVQSLLKTKDVASHSSVLLFKNKFPNEFLRYTSHYLIVRPPCAPLEFMKDKNLQQLIHSQISYTHNHHDQQSLISQHSSSLAASDLSRKHCRPKTVYRLCEYYPIVNKLISTIRKDPTTGEPWLPPEVQTRIVTMIYNMAIGKSASGPVLSTASSSISNDINASISNTMYMSVSTNNNALVPSDDIRRDVVCTRGNGSVTNNVFSGGRIHMSMLDVLAHKKGLFRQMFGGTRPMYTVRGVIVCDTDVSLWQVKVSPKVQEYVKNKSVFLCRQPTLYSSGMQLVQTIPYETNMLVLGVHHELSGSFNQDYDGDEMTLYVTETEYTPCEPDAILNSLSVLMFSELNGTNIVKCSYNTVMAFFVLTSWPDDVLEWWFVDYLKNKHAKDQHELRKIQNIKTYKDFFLFLTYMWVFGGNPSEFQWTSDLVVEAFGSWPWTKKNTTLFDLFAIRACKGDEERLLSNRSRITRFCDDFMTQYGFDISAKEISRCSELFKKKFGKVPEHFEETKSMVDYWQKVTSTVMDILDERDTLSVMVNSGAKATPVHVLQAIGCIGPSVVNFYSRNFAKMCRDVGVCVFGGDDSNIGGDVSCAWLYDNLWDGLRPVQQFIMSCNSIENMVRSIVCTGEGGYWRRSVQFTLDGLAIKETFSVVDVDHDEFVYPPVCNVGGAADYVSSQFFTRFGIPYYINSTDDITAKCVTFDSGMQIHANDVDYFVDSDGGLVRLTHTKSLHYYVNSLIKGNNKT